MTRRPRKNEHWTTMYRATDDGGEVELTVTYTITPYDPGISYGPAERCYPPEGGEVEITEVTDADGNAVEPTEAELEAWTDRIYEEHDFDA
jgi:hypothetical protein